MTDVRIIRSCAVDGCPRPHHAKGYCSIHDRRRRRHGDPLFVAPSPTAAERIYARIVREPSGCWRWVGAMSTNGYGQMSHAGRQVGAHRLSYELHVGPIPAGLVLDHLCRNRACVNPDHLEAVPQSTNVLRGLSPVTHQPKATHCRYGHELTAANVYIPPGDAAAGRRRRVCRTCAANRDANRRRRKFDG